MFADGGAVESQNAEYKANILKMKLQSKIKSQGYDSIGEVPGVSQMDESKRRRILKDLGVAVAPPTAAPQGQKAEQ